MCCFASGVFFLQFFCFLFRALITVRFGAKCNFPPNQSKALSFRIRYWIQFRLTGFNVSLKLTSNYEKSDFTRQRFLSLASPLSPPRTSGKCVFLNRLRFVSTIDRAIVPIESEIRHRSAKTRRATRIRNRLVTHSIVKCAFAVWPAVAIINRRQIHCGRKKFHFIRKCVDKHWDSATRRCREPRRKARAARISYSCIGRRRRRRKRANDSFVRTTMRKLFSLHFVNLFICSFRFRFRPLFAFCCLFMFRLNSSILFLASPCADRVSIMRCERMIRSDCWLSRLGARPREQRQ